MRESLPVAHFELRFSVRGPARRLRFGSLLARLTRQLELKLRAQARVTIVAQKWRSRCASPFCSPLSLSLSLSFSHSLMLRKLASPVGQFGRKIVYIIKL